MYASSILFSQTIKIDSINIANTNISEASIEILPPYNDAYNIQEFEILTKLGFEKVLYSPNRNEPSTGKINQSSLLELYIVGQNTYHLTNKVVFDFSVPETSDYNISIDGIINGGIFSGSTGGISDYKQLLIFGFRVLDEDGGLKGQKYIMPYNTWEEEGPNVVKWVIEEFAMTSAKTIIAIYAPSGWISSALNVINYIELYNKIFETLLPEVLFKNDTFESYNHGNSLSFDTRLKSGEKYKVEFINEAYTGAGISSLKDAFVGMSEITTSFNSLNIKNINIDEPSLIIPELSVSKGLYSEYILVSWSPVLDGVFYDIYRNTINDNSTAIKIGAATSSISSIEDNEIEEGVTYYYWIKVKKNVDDNIVYSEYSDMDFGWLDKSDEVIFKVTPENLNVSSSSGTASFSVDTNIDWSVEDDASWLTATKTSSSSIRINYEKNPFIKNRTANLLVYNAEGNDATITITQSGIIASDHENIALSSNGGIATAISEGEYLGVKHYASLVNDNDSTTFWASKWSLPAWLVVEFDSLYLIDKVGVLWGLGTHNQSYSISLSKDNIYWNTVVPTRASNTNAGYSGSTYNGSDYQSHEMFDIEPIEAKYMKIDITQTSAPSSHIFQTIIHEIEAYRPIDRMVDHSWHTNFEEYPINTFPTDWIADGNATNSSYGFVDNSNSSSGLNSFKLFGRTGACWAAIAFKQFELDPPFSISLDVKTGDESVSGCHPDRAHVGIAKGASWRVPGARSLINFLKEGTIKVGTDTIRSYATNVWYNVLIKYEYQSKDSIKETVWLDDIQICEFIFPAFEEEQDFRYLKLEASEGSAWFDNIEMSKTIETKTLVVYNQSNVRMYPNPTRDILIVDLLEPFQTNTIVKLVDMSGRVVEKRNLLNNKIELNVSNLLPGIYMIIVQNEKNSFVRKLLVESN